MLSRIGLINLSVGDIRECIDIKTVNLLNKYSSNEFDPVCSNCKYQSNCGVDIIDKISRYQDIKYPTDQTYFCKEHFKIFEFIEAKIRSNESENIKNLLLHLTGVFSNTTLFRDWLDD